MNGPCGLEQRWLAFLFLGHGKRQREQRLVLLTLLFGSALVDLIGMKRMLLLAALGYIAGAAGLLAATMMPVSGTVETVLLVSLLL